MAAHSDRLTSALPWTAQQSAFEVPPSDIMVNLALRFARHWRYLAEMRTLRPLADTKSVRETLQSMGFTAPEDNEIADWLASVRGLGRGPALIRAGRAGREWTNLAGVKERNADGSFLAACLWQEQNREAPIPLPFWSAPEPRHHRLSLKIGLPWLVEFLDCVTAAASIGLRELKRLQETEQQGRTLGVTARSRLPDALAAIVREPVVTAVSLASTVGISPQAALGLLRQLVTAGIAREATGRASWRAFVLKE